MKRSIESSLYIYLETRFRERDLLASAVAYMPGPPHYGVMCHCATRARASPPFCLYIQYTCHVYILSRASLCCTLNPDSLYCTECNWYTDSILNPLLKALLKITQYITEAQKTKSYNSHHQGRIKSKYIPII